MFKIVQSQKLYLKTLGKEQNLFKSLFDEHLNIHPSFESSWVNQDSSGS